MCRCNGLTWLELRAVLTRLALEHAPVGRLVAALLRVGEHDHALAVDRPGHVVALRAGLHPQRADLVGVLLHRVSYATAIAATASYSAATSARNFNAAFS